MKNSTLQEKTLQIEISRNKDHLKITTNKKSLQAKETLHQYEEKTFDPGRIAAKCLEIVRLLNNANIRGNLAGENFSQLRVAGLALFEDLLSHDAQKDLSGTACENLIINIDDGLVHIPWELLHDGTDFLCRKFNVGRVVRTRQKIVKPKIRTLSSPVKILIISDPCGDLKKAYEEGDHIRQELDQASFLIHADLFNRRISTSLLKEYLRNYDLVHFAGHADYNPQDPSESGWILQNGRFNGREILQFSRNIPMPALIFSNACQSGQTGEWLADEGFEDRIFGLANAFLVSGVQHYIGTFWEVLDEASCEFAVCFYQSLIGGEPVGGAVRKAREHLIAKYGEQNIIWATYMLYGSPDFSYFQTREMDAEERGLLHKPPKAPFARDYEISQAQTIRSIPPDRKTFNLMVVAYIALFLSLALLFFLLKDSLLAPRGSKKVPAVTPAVEKNNKEENLRIIQALSQKYEEQQKRRAEQKPPDPWTSRPLTLSLLGFTCLGDYSEKEELEQFFLTNFSQALQSTGRVSLVERARIAAILEELNISTAGIADQDMALIMLGKLLGARLICTGKIMRLQGEDSINLRVFETATSQIAVSLHEVWHKKEKARAVASLTEALTREITRRYPIRAKIAKVKTDEVLINVGAAAGVKPDTHFSVLAVRDPLQMDGKTLGYDEQKIGTVKITKVQQQLAHAAVVKQSENFQEGMRIMEVVQ